jgi:hypothetical protein
MQQKGLVTLSAAEVAAAIAGYSSSATFKRLLEGAAHRPALLPIVGRFIHLCSVFGGCQASLAGELAVRQDLFRDLGEPEALADNSVEVAAGVFFGAIDEFGDREDHHRRTHRALAQATLKGLARFYQCDDSTLRQLVTEHAPTRTAIARALAGYGVNLVMDSEKVFRALGFHLATEIIADQEFNILHNFFRDHRPDLVTYLEQNEVRIGGKVLPAYFWISRHSVADAEHFAAAVESANLALRYHVPVAQCAEAKAWMLAGVVEMAQMEADFMNAVSPDVA